MLKSSPLFKALLKECAVCTVNSKKSRDGRITEKRAHQLEVNLSITRSHPSLSQQEATTIESVLHMEMRTKHGNAQVPGVKSVEIYATKHLQEILDPLIEREKQTTAQLQDLKAEMVHQRRTH